MFYEYKKSLNKQVMNKNLHNLGSFKFIPSFSKAPVSLSIFLHNLAYFFIRIKRE